LKFARELRPHVRWYRAWLRGTNQTSAIRTRNAAKLAFCDYTSLIPSRLLEIRIDIVLSGTEIYSRQTRVARSRWE